MSANLWVARILIAFVWIYAAYGTWYLFFNNGAREHVHAVLSASPSLLPGTVEPVKTVYTGIKAVDDQITLLAVVFWEAVDGSMPDLSLFCFSFGGQFAGTYILMLVESARQGNRGRLISLIAVFGLMAQMFTYACMLPLYILLFLATSPTVLPKSNADFIGNDSYITVAPLSVAIGFVGPAILMSLSAPSIITLGMKQNSMMLWQVFPLTVGILQYFLSFIYDFFSQPVSRQGFNPARSLSALRSAYLAAFIYSSVTHVATIAIMALNVLFPPLFAPQYQDVFAPSRVLSPAGYTSRYQAGKIGEGMMLLLQFDEQASGAALMIWAVTLYLQADRSSKSLSRWATLVGRLLLANILAGPSGVAVTAIWARDELILGSSRETDVRKMQ